MIDEGKPERREVWKRPKFALLLHYRSPSTRSGRQKRRRQGGALETWSLMNTKSRDAVKELFYFYCYFIPPNVGLKKPSKGKSQILAKQQKWIEAASTWLSLVWALIKKSLGYRNIEDNPGLSFLGYSPTSYCIHFLGPSRFLQEIKLGYTVSDFTRVQTYPSSTSSRQTEIEKYW